MVYTAVDTVPIRIDAPPGASAGRIASSPALTPQRADAVRAALLSRTVPLARAVDGRPEPLATGALVAADGLLALLTAAHVFEHAGVGDLLVPLPRDDGWCALRGARPRVLLDTGLDIALLIFSDGTVARRLRDNWLPVALAHLQTGGEARAPGLYALAGYPVSQTRRVDGRIFMKPVVLFAPALDDERLAYSRTADRVDGLHVHTPELDGVSGALVWALYEDDGEDGDATCVLRPAALQTAFEHGRHVRTAPLRSAPALFSRLRC